MARRRRSQRILEQQIRQQTPQRQRTIAAIPTPPLPTSLQTPLARQAALETQRRQERAIRRQIISQLPFAGSTYGQMVSGAPGTAGTSVVTRSRAQNVVTEQRLAQTHILSLGPNSRYEESYMYEVVPNTALMTGLTAIWIQMQRRVSASTNARVRIAYRDRETLVRGGGRGRGTRGRGGRGRGGGRTGRQPDFRVSTHTAVFRGPAEFRDGFQDFVDAVERIVASNEDLDFANFQFILDLSSSVRGGGGKGSGRKRKDATADETESTASSALKVPTGFYNNPNFKNTVPEHLRYSSGILFVPEEVDGLCGWCCLVLHWVYHHGLQQAVDMYDLPHDLWTRNLPPSIYMNCSGESYSKRMAGWLQRNTRQLKTVAKVVKQHFGSENEHFTIPDDAKIVCEKLPELKIIIVGAQSTKIAEEHGSEYELSEAESDEEAIPQCVYLFFDRHALHYHYVCNPLKFTNKKKPENYKWCHECCAAFTHCQFRKHKCVHMICKKCGCTFNDVEHYQQHCQLAPDHAELVCSNCNTECHNEICFNLHRRNCNASQKKTECDICGRWVHDMNGHKNRAHPAMDVDRTRHCQKCFDRYPVGDVHHCMIKRLPVPKPTVLDEELLRFYGFDFESAFVTNENGADEHEVNFVAVRQFGSGAEWTFENLSDFCQWLFGLESKAVFYAHNMSAYDGRLLFDHLVNKETYSIKNTLWRGSKIMGFTVEKYMFCDSLLHVQAALAEFPKIFGLDESQFAKGFFPYKFNRLENQDYVGTIPPIQMFEPNMMSSGKRKEFLKWYEEQRNVIYNFRAELERYCISDVRILVRSLEVYMRDGMEMNSGLNPLDNLTIASYAMRVYRTLHMPNEALAALRQEHADFARRAMHGGRTDVRRMCRFVSESEMQQNQRWLCYQDVQSLYPTVQFYKELPVGVPVTHVYDDSNQPTETEVMGWFGFVECDLELTCYIHHPVIVCHNLESGKLQADLMPKQRIVVTTPELQCALQNGYKLKRVWEYHQYQRSTDLFKSYIRRYLKLKIECGGMPAHIQSDEQWDEYALYHRRELGVELERSKMVKNAGKKQLAKMMLNSLWGKFAEAGDYTKEKICHRPDEYLELECLWDMGSIDITFRMQCLNGDVMVAYRQLENGEDIDRLNMRTNVALASFVTAWGALILWEQMNLLGKRVLYHDTDSIIYERDPEKYNIPVGKYLGEWEDETGGKPIVQFVSTGPKTYAYAVLENPEPVTDEKLTECLQSGEEFWVCTGGLEMRRLKYKCKSKGFSQNYHNESLVNFKQLHRLLIGDIETIKTCSLKFNWNRMKGEMTSGMEEKLLSLTYDKGVIDRSDFMVYPYGYENYAGR
jgi:hypothetical protein